MASFQLKHVVFPSGDSASAIDRLCQSLSLLEPQKAKLLKGESLGKIEQYAKCFKLPNAQALPLVYRHYLEKMGANDADLLKHEWDGCNSQLEDVMDWFLDDEDLVDLGNEVMIAYHWTDAYLVLRYKKKDPDLQSIFTLNPDNPPVYYTELFATTFENYLFAKVFRRATGQLFKHHSCFGSCSKNINNFVQAKQEAGMKFVHKMDLVEQLLAPWNLEKAWFSDEANLCAKGQGFALEMRVKSTITASISSNDLKLLNKLSAQFSNIFNGALYP